MKKLFGILALAALVPVSSWAQLAPYNKMGVTWAHVHIRAKDRTKETLALMSLGARLGNNLSPNLNVVFPGLLILLQEGDASFRQVFLDGRPLPKDPQPSWMGYSVGKWDGNALVVETIGLRDQGWLDALGHPHSDALRVVERFQRRDFGHMEIQITIDDPKTYQKPFTYTQRHHLTPDNELLENICLENERDSKHLVGK